MPSKDELDLITRANHYAIDYLKTVDERPAFPDHSKIDALSAFDTPFPEVPSSPDRVLKLLNDFGTPATVTSNGPNYFGFVLGGVLPAAAAADRLVSAWDQCSFSKTGSPTIAAIEKVAGHWLLDVLDLPRESAVGFGTSATACGLTCLATARRFLLEQSGWDIAKKGTFGAPRIRVIVPKTVHVTIYKILKILGFGSDDIIMAPTDAHGRVIVSKIPKLDNKTILCLQAGEVNTGEFDPFAEIIPRAKAAGAWVHVDGAFGLWARASRAKKHLTDGIDLADSWTTDGHKWLNTPYDSAVAICRHPELLSTTLSANASYASADHDAQQNLTLEFSRRGRGVAIWAALHSLGRTGVNTIVDQYCSHATRLAQGCSEIGINVQNRVVLNQVLCKLETPEKTQQFVKSVQDSGKVWFGGTVWNDEPAFRLSVSSWRTQEKHIKACLTEMKRHL